MDKYYSREIFITEQVCQQILGEAIQALYW